MKLSKSTLVVPLAGLLLIGAAGAVAATSGPVRDDADPVAAAPSATPSASSGATTGEVDVRDTALSDVLDDLVADGTINESQKTAILDALAAERTARREEREARREQLQGFLEDGVITQEEFDQLPEDSALRTLTTLMDDGQITTDELRTLGRGLLGGPMGGPMGGGRGGHGHGFFGGLGGDDGTVEPSASPTTGS